MINPAFPSLDVCAGDGGSARGAAVGVDGAALLDVEDLGARDAQSAAAGGGDRAAGEGDGAEVGEWDHGVARLEVLDNCESRISTDLHDWKRRGLTPLSIGLAQLVGLSGEGVSNRLARAEVLNCHRAGGRGGGSRRHLD